MPGASPFPLPASGCAISERRRPLSGLGWLASRSISPSIVSLEITTAGQRSIVSGAAPLRSRKLGLGSFMLGLLGAQLTPNRALEGRYYASGLMDTQIRGFIPFVGNIPAVLIGSGDRKGRQGETCGEAAAHHRDQRLRPCARPADGPHRGRGDRAHGTQLRSRGDFLPLRQF